MSRLRKPQANYTQITNTLLRDKHLSLKAKGLYALLFSKPDDWTYIESVLIEESTDGKDSFRSAMRELIAFGWLTKQQTRKPDGTVGHTEWWLSADGLTVDGKPADGLPADGESASTNTDITKTDLTKTDLVISAQKSKKEKQHAKPLTTLEQNLGSNPAMPDGWGEPRMQGEWERFCNYHIGKGTKWRDWKRAWDNWCSGKFTGGQPAQHRASGGGYPSKLAAVCNSVLADRLREEGVDGSNADPF